MKRATRGGPGWPHWSWKVRYLVVKTGERLLGRKVVILPEALAEGWHGESGVPVNLAKSEIQSSPDIDTAHPLSQLAGQLLYDHYAWPPSWSTGIAPPASGVISAAEQLVELPAVGAGRAASHLYRVEDVLGYKLSAKNGEAGRLEDLVIHEDAAEVRYVAVHLPKALAAKTVLIHTCDVSGFDWENRILVSPLWCHEIEASPEYENALQ